MIYSQVSFPISIAGNIGARILSTSYTIVPQWQKEAVMFAKLYVSKKKFNDSTYKKTPNL